MSKIQGDKSLISKPFTILHVGTNDIAQRNLSIEKIMGLFSSLISLIRKHSKTHNYFSHFTETSGYFVNRIQS